jgi:hypothetical protein
VHRVQAGQTLWTIAAAYKVSLPELLQINGFTEGSYIFPGDEVLVKSASQDSLPPAQDPQVSEPPSAEPTGEQTSLPLSTPQAPAPTRTEFSLDQASELLQTPSAGLKEADSASSPGSGLDSLLLIVAALVFSGAVLMIAGNILKRGG